MKKYLHSNIIVFVLVACLPYAERANGKTTDSHPVPEEIAAKSIIFTENFESGIGSWTSTFSGVHDSFTPRYWVTDNTAPSGHPGMVAYGTSPSAGECGVVLENGIISLTSPLVTIPEGPNSTYYFAFDHYFNLETNLDGANFKYRINNGTWTLVPAGAIGINSYNTTLLNSEAGSNNPMGGQPAYSGVSPAWQNTTVNLSILGLKKGDAIELRWDVGTDSCGGTDGWYIDNVEIYSVEIPIPPIPPKKPLVHFERSEQAINELGTETAGSAPNECIRYTDYKVKVVIDTIPSSPVTILVHPQDFQQENYIYATEGAKMDFQIVSGKIVFQEGDELSKEATVRVYNDTQEEDEERITLTFTLLTDGNAEAGDPNILDLFIVDDDTGRRVQEDDLFLETFETTSIPEGWVTEGTTEDEQWGIRSFDNSPPFTNYCLSMHYVGSREYRTEFERYIDTPVFNSSGYSELSLSFDQILYLDLDSNDPKVEAQIWTGTSWESIWERKKSTDQEIPYDGRHIDVPIPLQYAGEQMKVRFRFHTYHSGNWRIDNVNVKGIKYVPTIQEELSTTPDQQYLGPNATTYFYDPETKAILAKIKNLTNHDYGCTSVQIDRAGNGTSDWVGGFSITDKTLKVIPSNPNPTGEYEITLYYTAVELGEFSQSITSMGKSEDSILIGDPGSSEAAPVQINKYNDNFAFTAAFHTGFSGFGLSNAPPSGSLPVRMVSFSGHNSHEGNLLEWITSEAVNHDYFVIERSSDAKRFSEIGRTSEKLVLGSGGKYSFTDKTFVGKKTYYRLKQVDQDGKFVYSKTIAINSQNLFSVSLYPNPVETAFTVNLTNSIMTTADIRIVNISGTEVVSKERVAMSGGKLVRDISNLPMGIYLVTVWGLDVSMTFSIFKL